MLRIFIAIQNDGIKYGQLGGCKRGGRFPEEPTLEVQKGRELGLPF